MESYSRPASLEDLKTLIRSLNDQGADSWFEEGNHIRVADAFVVGIMLNACDETFDALQGFAETIELDGLPIRTVNLEGLPRTRQTTRDKDVADRIVLERALKELRERSGASGRES